MSYKKQTLSTLIMCAAPLMLVAGCAKSDSTASQAVQKSSLETAPKKAGYDGRAVYLKPGAAIRLSHDYDDSSIAGGFETIQITLSDGYDAGTLTLDIVQDSGLTYAAAQQHIFDMSSTEDHTLSLQIGTPQNGMHHLNLFANVQNENGSNMQRSFSIAFYVGDAAIKPKYEAAQKALAAKGGNTFIIMDAQETIKTK